MTRTHTVPPIVVTANGDLGFRRNNQMGSLCREAQEGFLEEVAHELRVSGWGGMFGTKCTLGHEAVDTTCHFSQEERCPFTAATSRGPLSILPTLETTNDPLQPHLASWEVASAPAHLLYPSQLLSFFPFVSLFSLGCRELSAALTILGPPNRQTRVPH
uniref:Uncharacterized protein n=1 Tax=Myotis myotis TaxID=51298 RepID=A0A7J7R803_MYOMY|nr:hypothetical protein mMyoMyo1_010874 [Myotis myotis]